MVYNQKCVHAAKHTHLIRESQHHFFQPDGIPFPCGPGVPLLWRHIMSNHVYNKFSLSGPTDIVQSFKDLAFRIDRASDEEIINFDLNSIVPMPGDLGIVSCATGNHALRLLNSRP